MKSIWISLRGILPGTRGRGTAGSPSRRDRPSPSRRTDLLLLALLAAAPESPQNCALAGNSSDEARGNRHGCPEAGQQHERRVCLDFRDAIRRLTQWQTWPSKGAVIRHRVMMPGKNVNLKVGGWFPEASVAYRPRNRSSIVGGGKTVRNVADRGLELAQGRPGPPAQPAVRLADVEAALRRAIAAVRSARCGSEPAHDGARAARRARRPATGRPDGRSPSRRPRPGCIS